MASVATDPVLLSVGSHSVQIQHGKWTREECVPVMSVTWRGKTVQVKLVADRYSANYGPGDERMGNWRVYVGGANGLTDLASRAINEACVPLALSWLNGRFSSTDPFPRYETSRSLAFYHAMRYQVREERYNADHVEQMVVRFQDELGQDDYRNLMHMVRTLRTLIEAFNYTPTGKA